MERPVGEYNPVPAVVIVYPRQSFSTSVSSKAVPLIKRHAAERGVPYYSYTGMLNRPVIVRSKIRSLPERSLVVYIGHGLGDRWVGNEMAFLLGLSDGIVTLKETHIFRGKHVIAIACDTGQDLGVRVLADGALSYISWGRPVAVSKDDLKGDGVPDVANTFAILVNSMIDTGDPQFAVTSFQYACDWYENAYRRVGNEKMARIMRFNRDGISVY